MRFIIGSGDNRMTFDRPALRDDRRSMAQTIKNHLFPGKQYRIAKMRGAAALAAAHA